MFFRDCYQKKIKVRVANALYHISDFTLVYTLSNHPKKLSHQKIRPYFDNRLMNVDTFFQGASFKNDEAYYQVLSDLKLGAGLVYQEQGSKVLLTLLDELIEDIELMKMDAEVSSRQIQKNNAVSEERTSTEDHSAVRHQSSPV